MTTNAIELPRGFRKALLRQLRGLAGWTEYREQHGIASNGPGDRQGIIAACAHFGLDIEALRAAYDAAPGDDAGEAGEGATENNEGATTMHHATQAPASSEAGNSEGEPNAFEGKAPDDVIADALAGLSVHLTPFVAGRLPDALRPLAEQAVRGPRVRTVVQVKRERAPGAPGASTVPDANVLQWVHAAQAFGLKGAAIKMAPHVLATGATVPSCDYAQAPAVDPDFVWNPTVLAAMVACDARGLNLWSFGPAGTGKTEGAAQYAARLRRPFVRIAIDRSTEAADIIGQWVLAPGGGMAWQDGKLTAAFRMPYAVVLIDEPTLMRPGALAVFQTALDTRRLYLPGGEIVEAEAGIFIIAADNTAGVGDDTGRYVDTNGMNAAFLDRFALRVSHDYMSPAVEAGMMHKRTRLPLAACRMMTDFAALTRRDVAAGKMTMGLTPRRLLAWANACAAGLDSVMAFGAAVVQGTAPEDRQALDMLASTSLASQHAEIDRLARGETAPVVAPVEMAPSATGARFSADSEDESL